MKLAMRVLAFWAWSLLVLTGCAELSQIGFPGDYGNWGESDLVGEVRDVDTRARQIELSTDAGRKFLVRYDNNTRVSYRQRDYAVANLEPGDYVAVRAQPDRDGRYFTDLITVKESVQERGGYGGVNSSGSVGRLEKLDGRVEFVDSRRGTLEIRDRNNRLVVVSLPYNAPRAITDRLNRLREGDYVRMEGRFLNRDRFELETVYGSTHQPDATACSRFNACPELVERVPRSRPVLSECEGSGSLAGLGTSLNVALYRPRRARLRADLLEEVVALIVDQDKRRKILHLNLPDRFHAKFRILVQFDLFDVFFCQYRRRAAD